MKSIFVMALDSGYEGHSPPVQAFMTEKEARAGVALAEASGMGTWQVYEVPIWPEAASIYFNIKPIADAA